MTAARRAVTLAGAMLGFSALVDPRLPQRWRPLVRAGLGSALVAAYRVPLGLAPPALYRGVRLGSAAAGGVALAVAVATRLPAVRSAMAGRELPPQPWAWLLWQIPVGTVWAEEASYRGALAKLATDAFGHRRGRLFVAATFALSHIPGVRSGESVVGTVVATGVAGWLFGWLRDRSGSLAAPMLAHLAVNEAGAVAALIVHIARQKPGL